MVYLYQNNSSKINQRRSGVNKFIQDIITNDDLCRASSVLSFLTDDDDKYEKFKLDMKDKIE